MLPYKYSLCMCRCFLCSGQCQFYIIDESIACSFRADDQHGLLLNMNVAQGTEHHLYECLLLWLVQQKTKSPVVLRTLACVHQ